MVRSTFHVACFNSSSEISHTLWPLVELLKYAGVGNRFQTPTSKSRKVRFESRKPRPPALRLLILIICYHHITSVCFFCVCVYSSLRTFASFDPSLRARTKTKNCHSTESWSSPAPARSLHVCTRHRKPSQLWMRRSAAWIWRRTQQQVEVLNPTGALHTENSSKSQHKPCSVPGIDFCFLWRHAAGRRPRHTFSSPAWDWCLPSAVKWIPIL